MNASPGDPRIRGVRKLDVCNVTAHSGKPSGQNNSGGKESQQICCVRIDPCASIWEGRTNRSQATIWNGMWPESRRVRHERDQGHVHRGHNPEKNEIHGDLACGTTHPIPANTPPWIEHDLEALRNMHSTQNSHIPRSEGSGEKQWRILTATSRATQPTRRAAQSTHRKPKTSHCSAHIRRRKKWWRKARLSAATARRRRRRARR